MAKEKNNLIKNLKITKPNSMEYFVNISKSKDKDKFIKRVERIVRGSMEYRDYIKFLKEHVHLDSCIFFQKVTNSGQNKQKRISIEIHHEPFTLYEIVNVGLTKDQDQGLPINDLNIADEVMELHYANKVGLVPLSKTAHQMVHDSMKLVVPLNMCYGTYSDFLEEYEPYIDDALYEKLERKMDITANLTPESFDAILKEFTYIEVDGYEDIEKMELQSKTNIA